MGIELVASIFILISLLFVATIDIAFSNVTDLGMRRITSEEESAGRKDSAQLLRDVIDNRPRFRFLLSSAIQILLIMFAVLITVTLSLFVESRIYLLAIALGVGLVATVIFRQFVPRLIVRGNPEGRMLLLVPVIRPLFALALAITSPFSFRTGPKDDPRLELSSSPDSPDTTEDNSDDLNALIEVGEAEGIIEEGDREMIETMIDFGETRTGEIMTPRTEICALPIESTVKDARAMIIAEKYSRLPVYRDSVDNIEGLIYVRDLLQAWADGKEDMPVSEILRDAYFVPETKTAADLLKSMQLNHVQIAIVIDEYGGVAGLVTVEDLLEEIVGEIEDEDIEQEEIIEIREKDGGYYEVLGSTEIDKIERIFDLDLEDEDYTTIAGLITSEAGQIPKTGDKLSIKGLEIEILDADDKRINLVRLSIANEIDTEE